MAPDVLERLRAADPAKRMPEPHPGDRDKLRRAIVTIPQERRVRTWWRRRLGGRTLVVLLAGGVLLASGTVYAEHLIMRGQETSITLRSGTWQRLPLAVDGGEVMALAIDPEDTAVLYAVIAEGLLKSRVFKSNDKAATWNQLQVGRDLRSVTPDPRDPSHLFGLASGEPGTPSLVESHDGGTRWSTVSGSPDVGGFGRLWIDRSSTPPRLYVGGFDRGWVPVFARSDDSGRTWSPIDTGVKGFFPSEMAIDPSAHMIYALFSDSRSVLVRSSNGGTTWRNISPRLPAPMRTAWDAILRIDPNDTSRLYLHALQRGVFASNDSGRTWSKLDGEARAWAMAVLSAAPGTPASAVQAASAFLSPFEQLATKHRLTDAASDLPLSSVGPRVIVDPGDPSTLYLATAQGVYKSTDTGATWHRASGGIENHNVFDVLVDRRSPSTLLALTPAGLARSTDAGSTSVTLLPAAVTSVIAAPSSPSTLYASILSGVLKSTDGGETWSRPHRKGLPAEPGSLDVALVAGDRPGTVYVNADGTLYKSTDAANTWRRVKGLPTGGLQLLEVPNDPSTLFATVYRAGMGFAASHAGRLFRSVDRGRTWSRIGGASWGAGPVALAIDPGTPSRMLIATEETPVWHRSTDGGRTWHHFTVRGPAMYPGYLVFDPRRRDTVYAVTMWDENHANRDPAVHRSQDGGATWEDLSAGLPDYWLDDSPNLVFAATPDGALYAATESGLYRWVPGDRRKQTKADDGG